MQTHLDLADLITRAVISRVGGTRLLHDYAELLYSHAPMAVLHPIPASHPTHPPVRGLAPLRAMTRP